MYINIYKSWSPDNRLHALWFIASSANWSSRWASLIPRRRRVVVVEDVVVVEEENEVRDVFYFFFLFISIHTHIHIYISIIIVVCFLLERISRKSGIRPGSEIALSVSFPRARPLKLFSAPCVDTCGNSWQRIFVKHKLYTNTRIHGYIIIYVY